MADRLTLLRRVLIGSTVLLITAVTARIVGQYGNYIPIDPQAEFVVDHVSAFRRIDYRIAFFVHIIASPISLVLGLVLLSERWRQRHLRLHRIAGRFQVALIMMAVVPSGLRLAVESYAGWKAGFSFLLLSLLLATFTMFGLQAAIQRRISDHRRWMMRSMLLMTSAIVLRLISGFFSLIGIEDAEPAYIMAAWLSWTMPLLAYEVIDRVR